MAAPKLTTVLGAVLHRVTPNYGSIPFHPGSSIITSVVSSLQALADAKSNIAAKAASLGALPGASLGDVVAIAEGYLGRYQGCDIYYSAAAGAHEVHGDILAKYNALHGPSVLGLPTSDEQTAPDQVGKFNHFTKNASIYWTPNTGPMMVRAGIRDEWAGTGWERGPFGYPVADEHTYQTSASLPAPILWSRFENGAIFSSADGVAVAAVASLSPAQMQQLIRQKFDDDFHKSPDNVGLHPQTDIVNVSGWSYGFWGAAPRTVTYRLYGFHDNGLAPDTEFTVEATFEFLLVGDPSVPEPTSKTIQVSLTRLSVHASGVGANAVAAGVNSGILDAFKTPVPVGDPITTGDATNVDVIDILTTADGGFQVLLNPLPLVAGGFRQEIAQGKMNALLG